jgi:hypothetical protein
MSQTNCESLQEMLVVEKYIRDNIETIVPKEPKMKDVWYYATVLNINSLAKTGTMLVTYENGQMQKEINFSYSKNGSEIKINLEKPVACTMDAKQCPDGSYVGRTGPKCEFVCPQ